MASTTTDKDEKSMASEIVAPGADEPRDEKPKGPPPRSERTEEQGGFFHIYKKGQGYWTRMGTAAAAALIAALTSHFLYRELPVWLTNLRVDVERARTLSIFIIAAFLAGFALLVFRLMNKPSHADFLIATDGEMKKVNWTSRRELIGSTKVVIIFMFFIAFILFAIDIIFGYFFQLINVLDTGPFG